MVTPVFRRGLEWLGGSWLVWLAMVSCSAGAGGGADGRTPPREPETGGTLASSGGALAESSGGRASVSGGATSTPGIGGRSATGGDDGYIPPVMAQPMPALEYDEHEAPCNIEQKISDTLSFYFARVALPNTTRSQRARTVALLTDGYSDPASPVAGINAATLGTFVGDDFVAANCAAQPKLSVVFFVPKS